MLMLLNPQHFKNLIAESSVRRWYQQARFTARRTLSVWVAKPSTQDSEIAGAATYFYLVVQGRSKMPSLLDA
jgi:hypothetical protein